MDHLQRKYIEEATDLINDLESAVLQLEKNPDDQEQIKDIFRVMHTLKGNSAMFGFEHIGEFTHDLESIYDQLRNQEIVLTPEVMEITLVSVDHLSNLLGDPELSSPQLKETHVSLLSKIGQLIAGQSAQPIISHQVIPENPLTAYWISFKPQRELLEHGGNPLYLIEDLTNLGEASVLLHTEQVPPLEELDPKQCYTYWTIFLNTTASLDDIKDVFIFVEGECELIIEKLPEQPQAPVAVAPQATITSPAPPIPTIKPTESPAAAVQETNGNTKKTVFAQSVRVASDKIDTLLNLVSELVTMQARLTMLATQSHEPRMIAVAEEMEKLTRRLRDTSFEMSLIPIDSVLTRFERMLRDLSKELNKEVTFTTSGTDTALDKQLIESLLDPLMHILRNSLDHGIEDSATRLAKGKPAKGNIHLEAFYSGAYVVINIKDDGKGIHPDKIRAKALEKGLIHESAILSKQQLIDLVFLPGFSTATQVTEVSGRGVGMDVVRKRIGEMRGSVEIHSEWEAGTVVSIKLPLSLSIIDGLLVRVGRTPFIIPIAAIDKIRETKYVLLQRALFNWIEIDGDNVPFINLREEFDEIEGETPVYSELIVVNQSGQRIAVATDTIDGTYQAVLKPLGRHYRKQEIVSGASILGDGTVALVLDVAKIIEKCTLSQNT